jgi:hypothetical protein
MSRKTKTDKPAVPPFDPPIEGKIVTANTKAPELAKIPDEPQPQDGEPESPPSAGRILGRLVHEAIYTIFFIGTHYLIKLWLVATGQMNEWWAQYLLTLSIIFALVAFTIIFGCELIVDCKRAIENAWKNIRK